MKVPTILRLTFVLMLMPVMAIAQDSAAEDDEATIRKIGDRACECTREIPTNLHKDTVVARINGCITTFIVENQTEDLISATGELLEKAVMAKKDTVVGAGETIVIYADKNFNEIQQYMFANCQRVKTLMALNNVESKLSMSKDKKALEYYNEGESYYNREQYDMAIVSFNKAVKRDPKFAFAWDNLGISYRKRGDFKEAIKCYKKSLEVDPSGTMPLQNMAVAYDYLKDYENAIITYEEIKKRFPTNPEGFYGAARAYYNSGDYAKGVDNMFKAYLLYANINSPYVNDAKSNLQYFYSDLKEKNKLDIFTKAAEANEVKIN